MMRIDSTNWRCILTYGFFNMSFNVTDITYDKYIPENLIDASIDGPHTSIAIQTGAIPGGSPEMGNTVFIISGQGATKTFMDLTLPWNIIDRLAEFCARHKTGAGNPGFFEEEFNLNEGVPVNEDPAPLAGGKRKRKTKRRKYT
jgi:hypothetical protein